MDRIAGGETAEYVYIARRNNSLSSSGRLLVFGFTFTVSLGIAAVTFASARAAERRIAGVAAAARVVRDLAEAGFAETRLVLPRGATLGQAAWRDLRRLGGAMLEQALSKMRIAKVNIRAR